MKEKVDFAVLRDAKLEKPQIEKWLKEDIERCYVLISELLNDQASLDALTNVMWKRYQKMCKQADISEGVNRVSEMLNGEDHVQ